MGIVDFNTAIWKDSWFRKLPIKAKVLFTFLWTNDHKNLACLYEIDVETISFYTGLTQKEIKDNLSILYPKVKYDYENDVVWVVNFVRHQFMRTENTSPKIKAGIKNNLIQNNGHFFIGEFLEEYKELSILYEYPIDRVSEGYQYPPGEGGGEGAGEGEGKKIKKVGKKFIPPELKDVIKFFIDNGYTEESAKKAFDYYADGEPPWTDSKGNQVRGWKQKMRGNWFRSENKESQSKSGSLKPTTYAQAQDAERRGRAKWLKEMEDDNQSTGNQGTDETIPLLSSDQIQ